MPKFKVSRPIVYLLVFGAVAYAAVLLTEPEPTARKVTKSRTSTSRTAKADGVMEEDRTAKFEPYTTARRDAFAPVVVAKKARPKNLEARPTPAPRPVVFVVKPPVPTDWNLTGIALVNGTRMALLENGSHTETKFLKVGEQWMSLEVTQIGQGEVIFRQSNGAPYRMVFASPTDIKDTKTMSSALPSPQAPITPNIPTNRPNRFTTNNLANSTNNADNANLTGSRS
jgi:hypothetical protein